MQEKTGTDERLLLPVEVEKPYGVGVWKNIVKNSVWMQSYSSIEVNDCKSIGFWHDKWNLKINEQLELDLLLNGLGPALALCMEQEDSTEVMEGFNTNKCYAFLNCDGETSDFQKFLWKRRIPAKILFQCLELLY